MGGEAHPVSGRDSKTAEQALPNVKFYDLPMDFRKWFSLNGDFQAAGVNRFRVRRSIPH